MKQSPPLWSEALVQIALENEFDLCARITPHLPTWGAKQGFWDTFTADVFRENQINTFKLENMLEVLVE